MCSDCCATNVLFLHYFHIRVVFPEQRVPSLSCCRYWRKYLDFFVQPVQNEYKMAEKFVQGGFFKCLWDPWHPQQISSVSANF